MLLALQLIRTTRTRENGGTLEHAQQIAAHESPRTTKLYDVINDPLELRNVAAFPEQAARATRLAARLRELRPMWPQDANGEPEDDDE